MGAKLVCLCLWNQNLKFQMLATASSSVHSYPLPGWELWRLSNCMQDLIKRSLDAIVHVHIDPFKHFFTSCAIVISGLCTEVTHLWIAKRYFPLHLFDLLILPQVLYARCLLSCARIVLAKMISNCLSQDKTLYYIGVRAARFRGKNLNKNYNKKQQQCF